MSNAFEGGILVKVKFLGHASIKIGDLLVDPWTKEIEGFGLKPNYEYSAEDRKSAVVCITHNHPDHRLGAEELVKESGATVVAGFELAVEFMQKGFKANFMNIGGTIEQDGWKIHMAPALHSASSNPNGFVLQKNGKTFYHAGDTAIFSEMGQLGEEFSIDLAFLPIGDRFTMGIGQAVKAAQMLKPKLVVPIHFNTFDLIRVDENEFRQKLEKTGIACKLLEPGQEIEI